MIGKKEKGWTHINYYTDRIVVSNPNANHHAYVINLYTLYSCPVGGMSLGQKNYIIDEDGYYRFPDSGMLVHRWVAEKQVVRRKLRPGEVVHHKNGSKLDNRSENLEVMSWKQHESHHKRYDTVKNIKTVGNIIGSLLGVKPKKRRRKKKWF